MLFLKFQARVPWPLRPTSSSQLPPFATWTVAIASGLTSLPTTTLVTTWPALVCASESYAQCNYDHVSPQFKVLQSFPICFKRETQLSNTLYKHQPNAFTFPASVLELGQASRRPAINNYRQSPGQNLSLPHSHPHLPPAVVF